MCDNIIRDLLETVSKHVLKWDDDLKNKVYTTQAQSQINESFKIFNMKAMEKCEKPIELPFQTH